MGPGLDGLEGKLMKWAAHVLMYPIADLLNLSVSTGEIPHVWKHARVTPLHKGGNSLDPNINRPISIICIIAKVLKVNTVYLHYRQITNNITSSFDLVDHHVLIQILNNIGLAQNTLTSFNAYLSGMKHMC